MNINEYVSSNLNRLHSAAGNGWYFVPIFRWHPLDCFAFQFQHIFTVVKQSKPDPKKISALLFFHYISLPSLHCRPPLSPCIIFANSLEALTNTQKKIRVQNSASCHSQISSLTLWVGRFKTWRHFSSAYELTSLISTWLSTSWKRRKKNFKQSTHSTRHLHFPSACLPLIPSFNELLFY